MSFVEMLVLLGCGFLTYRFLDRWYKLVQNTWPPDRGGTGRLIMGALPPAAALIIFLTLRILASFDVVESFIFIVFYILLGYAWLYFGLYLMAVWFDLSWIDDTLHLNNRGALLAIAGGFLGLTFIYCGANIGDGPGWWCVIFAGGLGLAAWFALGVAVHAATGVFERITVERDVHTGIRFGGYLLASGLLLARASGGDWTSFSMTVVEFLDGWPVLILAGAAILVERFVAGPRPEFTTGGEARYSTSVLWGVFYLVIAVISILLMPPMNQNPLYSMPYYY